MKDNTKQWAFTNIMEKKLTAGETKGNYMYKILSSK